ncbi:hypothetical protein BC834DRAFT_840192 [Gloeopeniophorella convolvens]|nr:hypothetical protein BC834DRAFT_840192 [Gloeopeniophorella convolvens]
MSDMVVRGGARLLDIKPINTHPKSSDVSHLVHPPIASLPTECLAGIFCHVRLLCDPSAPPKPTGKIPHWITITQVCGHWRRVAHACSELWTDLPLVSMAWTRTMLEHSRSRPVVVLWDKDAEEDGAELSLAALRAALDALPRVRELALEDTFEKPEVPDRVWFTGPPPKVRDRSPFIDEVVDALCQQHAPLLEAFSLNVTRDEFIQLPPELFKGEALPALRKLDLSGFSISPTSPCIHPGLSTLSLVQCRVWESAEDMLETIASLPNLEVLSIGRGTFPPILDEVRLVMRSVSLPKLRDLSIFGLTSEVTSVLGTMTFPEEAELYLYPECDDYTRDEIHAFATVINQHYASRIEAGFKFQTLSISEDEAMQGIASWTAKHPIADGEEQKDLLEVTPFQTVTENGLDFGLLLLPELPMLDSIRTLDVSGCLFWFPVPWNRLTELATNIEHLILTGMTTEGFLVSLDLRETFGQMAFPQLVSLTLRAVVLSEPNELVESSPPLEQLKVFLHRRKGATHPLKLILKECGVMPSTILELQNEFSTMTLVWDGIKQIPQKGGILVESPRRFWDLNSDLQIPYTLDELDANPGDNE